MLGGSIALRGGAGMPVDFVACFMLFTFLLTGLIEIMLIRNLTMLTGLTKRKHHETNLQQQQPPLELRPASAQTFGEPISSVTDNTTRTLEYARRER
jgi:hypothetical protein